MTQPHYETAVLIAFLEAHGGRGPNGRLVSLNDESLSSSARTSIMRWRTLPDVPLWRVDNLLTRHGLHLFELDMWASEHFGRDGIIEVAA